MEDWNRSFSSSSSSSDLLSSTFFSARKEEVPDTTELKLKSGLVRNKEDPELLFENKEPEFPDDCRLELEKSLESEFPNNLNSIFLSCFVKSPNNPVLVAF